MADNIRPDPDATPNWGAIGLAPPTVTQQAQAYLRGTPSLQYAQPNVTLGVPQEQGAVDFLRGAGAGVAQGLNPMTGIRAAGDELGGAAGRLTDEHPRVAAGAKDMALKFGASLLGPTGAGAIQDAPAALAWLRGEGKAGAPEDPSASAAGSGSGGTNPYDRTFGTMSPGSGGGGLQLSQPSLIGAHFDPSRIPLRGSTQQELYGALDNSGTVRAGNDLAKTQANAADVSANLLESEAERATRDRASRMVREDDRQQTVRGMLDNARKLSEQAQQATVNMGSFYENPGNIMMAMGAVIRPGNEGMAMLERAFDREVSNQREEITRKRQAGLDAFNRLNEYQKAFGDERASDLAFEADARDVARMKLLALAERSQSPQIMAQANLVATQLGEQSRGKRADLTARLDQLSYVPAHVVGGTAQSKPLEHVVNLPNGVSLQMPTKDLQQKAIEKIEFAETIRRNNNEALRLREVVRKDPKQLPQVRQQLKSLEDQTISMLSLARGQGTVREPEYARAVQSTAAYTSLTPGSDKTIRAGSDYAVQDLGTFMRASGAEQVQRGYTQTPGKGIQPTGAYTGNNVTPQPMQNPGSFQLQMPQTIKSSLFTKMPVAGSGPAGATFDVMGPGGSLDVMGSLAAHGNYGTRFANDPTGGMAGGGILSSKEAKTPARGNYRVEDAGSFVPILGADPGTHQGADGRAYVPASAQAPSGASLSGPVPQYSSGPPPSRGSAGAGASRPRTHDEILHDAQMLEQRMRGEHEQRMAGGPEVRRLSGGTPQSGYDTELTGGAEQGYQRWHQATSPWDSGADYDLRGAYAQGLDRDGRGHLPDTYKKPNHETFSNESQYSQYAPDVAGSWQGEKYTNKGPPAWLRQQMENPLANAARAQAGEPWAYKPEFRPPGQAPGEVNVGPYAENMQRDPLASTAVKPGANGLPELDPQKTITLNAAINADQQKQLDTIARAIAFLAQGRH